MSRRRGLTWVIVGLLLALQCALVLSQVGSRTTQPHDVSVVVQGPGIVAQTIVDRSNNLPGQPVQARLLAAGADPRAVVRDGRAAGALVVNLSTTKNVLYLSSVGDPDLDRALRQLVTRASAPMGHTVETRDVVPLHHAGVTRATSSLLSGLWILLGFLLAVLWFSSARSKQGSAVRGALPLAGASVAVGLLAAAAAVALGAGSLLTLWAVGSLATYAAAIATVALERLFGLVGMAVAITLFIFFTAPLFSGRDIGLLAPPWREVAPWTPHGATVEMLTSLTYFGPSGLVRPVLVLCGAIVVALVALASVAERGAGLDGNPSGSSNRDRWRLRAFALVVPTALALAAAVAVAPAGARVPAPERVEGATETGCVPKPTFSSVKDLNAFIQDVRTGPSFQGADVGADVLLQDGRRLWVFGDTLRAPDFVGERFVRNSMLAFDAKCVRTVLPADHGALISDRDAKVGYWPMSIGRESRKGYDLVGVATQRVQTTKAPDGSATFEALGPSMAVFVVVPGKPPQLVGRKDIGPDNTATTRPMWGAAATVSGEWVYLYGTARPHKKGVFGFSLRVARSRPDNLLKSGTWQYWDGHRWQGSPAKASVLIPATGGVSQTLSVFEKDHRWYAVSKRDEFLGTDLVVWSAPSPTGPFDAGTTVAKLPSDLKSGQLRYMPLAHPDLLKDPTSVLISFSRNNTDLGKVEDNPFLYRPQFMRITLPQ